VLVVLALLGVGTGAALATTTTVKRCGYVAKGFYGKDAIYPWHMSCMTARRAVAVATNPNAKRITLTADGASTGDAGPAIALTSATR
jgi:hypothetical protein